MNLSKKSKILIIFLLSFITLSIAISLFFVMSYRSWVSDFENDIPSNELVTKGENNNIEEIEEEIKELNYILDDTVALELTTQEVSSLLLNSLQENEALDVDAVYIKPIEKGKWEIYLKIKILDKISMWIMLDMRKEERETAEIFVKDLYISQYSLTQMGFESVIANINQSLSSALITAEENGFVGRTFDNIELLETVLVLKLSKY